jgi:hypothetical protein
MTAGLKNASRVARWRVSVCLFAVSVLAACGGGDEGGSSATPSPNPSAGPPRISASLSVAPGTSAATNGSASIRVFQGSSSTPITNAQVQVNGLSVPYVAANSIYTADLQIAPGSTQTVSVTVNGTTYTQSIQASTTFPSITAPVSNSTWVPLLSNPIRWTAASPSPDVYLVGVTTPAGQVVWPTSGFQQVPRDVVNVDVAANVLTTGDYSAVVIAVHGKEFTGAAENSSLAIGEYARSKVTLGTLATTLRSLSFQPDRLWVEPGKSMPVAVTGKFWDDRTADVTGQVTLTTLDAAKATVLNAGASGQASVAGVARGSTTVRAQVGTIIGETSVAVFSPIASAKPPLASSVSFQADTEHSGLITFNDAALAFPPAAHWSRTLPGIASSAVIANGRAFVWAEPSWLFAFDLATGADVWGPVPVSATFGDTMGIAYDRGRLFVSVMRTGEIAAYDATSGAKLWSTVTRLDYSAGQPVARNGLVYVAGDSQYRSQLYALDAETGELMWSRPVGTDGRGTPTVTADAVFVASNCGVSKLHAYSGAALWSDQPTCVDGFGSPTALGPGGLYVREQLDFPNEPPFPILDPQTGVKVGAFTSGSNVPALSGDTAYFTFQGLIATPARAFSSPLWKFTGDGRLDARLPPFLIDKTAFTVSSLGRVYALDATSGAERWSTSISVPNGALDGPSRVNQGFAAGEGWLMLSAHDTVHAWKVKP